MTSIHKEMMVDASLEEVWADRKGYLFALCASRALRLIRPQRALLPRRPRRRRAGRGRRDSFNAEIAETAKATYLLCVLRGLCV
jgi:hypothetical protein